MGSIVTKQPQNVETARRNKAKELFDAVHELEAHGEFEAALKYYRQSLTLHEDDVVKKAYFDLLATVGPL